jgi:hypothetical protein
MHSEVLSEKKGLSFGQVMHLLSLVEKKGLSISQICKAPDSADFLYSSLRSSIFFPSRIQFGALRFVFESGLIEDGST